MKRAEWIQSMTTEEAIFRITRGCDRCGYFLPDDESGVPVCRFPKEETVCREEHEAWLEGDLDF